MKKEVLRIQQLNYLENDTQKLVDINLYLLAGECTGFLGLIDSGKSLLTEIISGNRLANTGSIFFDGEMIADKKLYAEKVYHINPYSYFVEDWSVAEYIGLENQKFNFWVIQEKVLVNQAKLYMDELGLHIPVTKRIKELTELEKRMMNLVKAYSKHARVLIIEDEFEGCSVEEVKNYKEILNRAIGKRNMSVIINSNSDQISRILSDKYVIFKNGSIVKKCHKNYIHNNEHLEKFMLRQRLSEGFEAQKDIPENKHELIYSVKNLDLKTGEKHQFNFYQGEICSILTLDVKTGRRIFDYISGRKIDSNLVTYLDGKKSVFSNTQGFIRNKIVSIGQLGDPQELILGMSPGENLLIPSLNKISAWEYLRGKFRLEKMAEIQIEQQMEELDFRLDEMGANDYTTLLLERWCIFKPKVLILYEPFSHSDTAGIALAKDYFYRFKSFGTSIVIIKSREEYIVDISDRIIHVSV
ncbi:MAG: ATP-binding cassette domain-containing protein [Lachnospiraceae bacterium]|nr:ATP-binding cassette domain-containing protein [Lachnospiraceae bacterium]